MMRLPVYRCVLFTLAGLFAAALPAAADGWPPAEPLAPATAEDAGSLPDSVAAEFVEAGDWHCVFQYQPTEPIKDVVLAGSFNGWNRADHPLTDADGDGIWTVQLPLHDGTYEYKFVVNGENWVEDPANRDRVPDGFGGFNSVLRLGRLARMHVSNASAGDGKVDVVGLEHQPTLPLYSQPLGPNDVLIRYRTLTGDADQIAVAVRGGSRTQMEPVVEGPLFTYYEAAVAVPGEYNRPDDKIRRVDYTFVLSDGGKEVADPHTYSYSFTSTQLFETPTWVKDAVWYQVMLDRFRNGDKANDPANTRPWTSEWFTPAPNESGDFYTYVFDRNYGGDLAGLTEKLPYLKDLGVTALYLNPVFEADAYHKYHTKSFIHIDDQFGKAGDYDAVASTEDIRDPKSWKWSDTDNQFREFIKAAHAAGMRVILDAVFNHVGENHPAFLDVKKNKQSSPFAEWFEINSWEPFSYNGWAEFAHLPVLKKGPRGFADQAVRDHFFAITKRWMDPNGDGDPSDGIDGWRLDVPNEVPLRFWQEWRDEVKRINPNAYITGEIWDRADRYLDGRHFDAVMNYQFAKIAVDWICDRQTKIPASLAASRFAELRLAYPMPATYALQNLVDSHDTDRLVSMVANPDREYDRENRVQDGNPNYSNAKPSAADYQRARLVALLQMTYVGAPMIYYGDEVGMWGADDPTNRKPMLWPDLQPYDQADENAVMADQLNFYRDAIALRNSHPALRVGAFRTVVADDDDDVWAFERSDRSERLIVVLNASDSQHDLDLPIAPSSSGSWQVVFGDGQLLHSGEAGVQVRVTPVSGLVLQAPR